LAGGAGQRNPPPKNILVGRRQIHLRGGKAVQDFLDLRALGFRLGPVRERGEDADTNNGAVFRFAHDFRFSCHEANLIPRAASGNYNRPPNLYCPDKAAALAGDRNVRLKKRACARWPGS